ncbi:M28 family peptidase [Olivibacter sp. SDN3]|uniref:M28 family peptidase n=1 Tax=Olivibacter sp. SDN3 TaxID=2764720 RepID=UPI001650FD0B|nr:M28 family peptidase [Olivibacter sp. SDN3]QNL50081.1 M28 family peptidase [Olivibacter sp. SDN3]
MLKRTIIIAFLTNSLLSGCFAQNTLQKQYAQLITEQSASDHLHIIASDEFEGRETGKEGIEKAAQYIAGEFKKLGLTAPVNGAYFQPVPLAENKFQVNTFRIGNHDLESGVDFYIINAENNEHIQDEELIFIGYGISDKHYDDLKDIDISGKVVLLINTDEPTNNNGVSAITGTTEKSSWATSRNKRIQHIIGKGPKLILAVSPETETLLERVRKAGSTGKMQIKEDIATQDTAKEQTATVAYITPKTANLILKTTGKSYQDLKTQIDSTGKPSTKQVKVNVDTQFGTQIVDVKARNVLGYLEGTDLKDELLVITAHYDHIGVNAGGQINNGADDDGSGVTGVLEIAKAFTKAKQDGNGPRRSILFMTVTGEEKGLLGSDYYARYPVFPLAQTVANLNIDMIGRIDPPHANNKNYVYLVGSDKLSSTLHQISEQANRDNTQLTLDYKYNDPDDPERIYYRSDHYNFAKNGIPVVFYFNGVHEDYHDIGDTVDKIDFEMLTKRAQLVFYTAWDLVNRDQRPVVDSNKK